MTSGRHQVIDSANAVGKPVASDMVPNKQHRLIRVLVIAAAFELGSTQLVVPVLHPLALPHRIDGQDEHARRGRSLPTRYTGSPCPRRALVR